MCEGVCEGMFVCVRVCECDINIYIYNTILKRFTRKVGTLTLPCIIILRVRVEMVVSLLLPLGVIWLLLLGSVAMAICCLVARDG